MNTAAIRMNQVTFTYSDGPVLQDMDLCVQAGEMVGVIGPNGAGKTTLLRLISGILSPSHGDIHLNGLDASNLKRSAMAKEVAVVAQQFNLPYAYKVEEVVMLGRTAFMRPFRDFTSSDQSATIRAMERVRIRHLSGRRFGDLSGGERQKVVLAMALAQEPKLLLLDEPIAHLDIGHQVEILELLAEMNEKQRLTIVAAMHDLNLASGYFRRLVLLKGGAVIADGAPDQVLKPSAIAAAYSVPVHVHTHPLTGAPYVVVVPPRNGHS